VGSIVEADRAPLLEISARPAAVGCGPLGITTSRDDALATFNPATGSGEGDTEIRLQTALPLLPATATGAT
jgi:hypothetical protein